MDTSTVWQSRLMRRLAVASGLMLATSAFGSTLTPIRPTASDGDFASFVRVAWNANSKEPIMGFMVYRGTTSDFDEADLIDDVGPTARSLLDYGAAPAVRYYYWVLPYDINGLGQGLSIYNDQGWRYATFNFSTSVDTMTVGSTLPMYFSVNGVFVRPTKIEITAGGIITKDQARAALFDWYNPATDRTFIKANGSFGGIDAYHDGTIYIRATYHSVSQLRKITIKKPTFKLYAPSGDIDIIETDNRDLYLKCNSNFVCPDVETLTGESAVLYRWVDAIEELYGEYLELLDNSFGWIHTLKSAESTIFRLNHYGYRLEYLVYPEWNMSKNLEFFYPGNPNMWFYANQYIDFGVLYGSTWLTADQVDLYMPYYPSSGEDVTTAYLYDEQLSNGAIATMYCQQPGFVTLHMSVKDRDVTGQIQVR